MCKKHWHTDVTCSCTGTLVTVHAVHFFAQLRTRSGFHKHSVDKQSDDCMIVSTLASAGNAVKSAVDSIHCLHYISNNTELNSQVGRLLPGSYFLFSAPFTRLLHIT